MHNSPCSAETEDEVVLDNIVVTFKIYAGRHVLCMNSLLVTPHTNFTQEAVYSEQSGLIFNFNGRNGDACG